MVNRFLKAKHWQIFSVTIGIPLLFQFFLIYLLIANFKKLNTIDPEEMFNFLNFFPLIIGLCTCVIFGWFWSVATGLQSKIPEHVTMKVKKFKILFCIPVIYMSLIILFMTFSRQFMNFNSEPNPGLVAALIAIIFPLHIFSMFCIFYIFYFLAKTVKTVELQRETKFGDFAGEFFMLWFYPVGVWLIQPKINKMIEE